MDEKMRILKMIEEGEDYSSGGCCSYESNGRR